MPLIAWSTLAYAGALIVALGATPAQRILLGASSLATALALGAAGRQMQATVAAVVAAAVLIAGGVAHDDATCARRLASAGEWRVAFEAAAHEGDVARGEATSGGCRARATLLVSHGSARAGEMARVRGRVTADARGIFIESAVLSDARA